MSSMFCYQCEQTAKGTGCTMSGVCGKDPETAALQDLLVYAAMGISQVAHRARTLGVANHEADVFVVEALFTTVTNVNFDPKRLEVLLRKAATVKDALRKDYQAACQKQGKAIEPIESSSTASQSNYSFQRLADKHVM